jgi:multicomponent Na+:H+ antiporter subunit C
MNIATLTGMLLILAGLWGMLTKKNIVKIIVGFSIIDTGIHLVMVSIGYLPGRTAPILDATVPVSDAANRVVDPIPSALVLTAIVIGLAVTALMLTYAVRLYRLNESLSIDSYKELKW